jgi:regulator of protease activity HflC (stomatin/prohibitin superfamily)
MFDRIDILWLYLRVVRDFRRQGLCKERGSFMRKIALFVLALVALGSVGCSSDDISQAHKGRLFKKTGILAFWQGGNGFDGPILGPGTHYTGYYNEIRQVDCSTNTVREHMDSLTKDGVQFGLDTYVRYSADCKDATVTDLLTSMVPDVNNKIISNKRLYETYIRPALGEAVRELISPNTANDINSKREEILKGIRVKFEARMKEKGGVTLIHEFVL